MDIKKAINIIEWLYEDGENGYTLSNEAKEALEIAIKALENQVLKNPKYVKTKDWTGHLQEVPFCSKCYTALYYVQNYCPECGQKINWEDDDTC